MDKEKLAYLFHELSGICREIALVYQPINKDGKPRRRYKVQPKPKFPKGWPRDPVDAAAYAAKLSAQSADPDTCFGDKVRAIRQTKGLKQNQVEQAGGLAHGYLTHIENGRVKKPSKKNLPKIAKGLGVPVEELEDAPPTPSKGS